MDTSKMLLLAQIIDLKAEIEELKKNQLVGTYRLYYRLRNNGDGSASAIFYNSREEAEEFEDRAIENGMDGWGESSVAAQDIYIENGQLVTNEQERAERTYEPINRKVILERIS